MSSQQPNVQAYSPLARTYEQNYVISQPTAWQSAPAPVRFAVWVWAVYVIALTIAAAVAAVIWVVFLFVSLGSM